ncbi:MAG TPA: pantoate--beta-alanine ligase [Gammaproteobacteria bacterium]|nr:pantoate--beta-alanine ligase [Gammaproteobacteria bacterium]
MQTVHTLASLRAAVDHWRSERQRVAFVPTMGNLHDGHLQLVSRAARAGERVVVSIFVNPTQFAPDEDFAHYPRTLKQDSLKLAENGVHLLFAPGLEEMYPHGPENTARVEVPGLSEQLEGAARPGFFTGVATVVTKLLCAVRPHVAVFGEKDYQQLLLVRRLVAELCMPVEIIAAPTVRELDGLAMSSRNSYLSMEQRRRAPVLYASLCRVRDRLLQGERNYAAMENDARHQLLAAGFRPDYVALRRAADLAAPAAADEQLVVLAAARLGTTRLIDNLLVTLKNKS